MHSYEFLQIKEVAPITPKHLRKFWKHDIKLARDYNQTHHADEDEFTQKLADELNGMQHGGVAIDTDFGAGLLRNINRKSYQNTWSPSCRNPMTNAITKDRRPSLADLEKICAHLSGSPNQCDRLRAAACYANGASKTFAAENLSPSQFRTLNSGEHAVPKKSRRRRAPSAPLPTHETKANHLEKINEVNLTASTSTVFETVPTASTSQSDDNLSAKSSATMTTTKSTSSRKIRRFIVTPAPEPL